MPRIRTIKPEFWTDDSIVDLDFATRLLFIGIWNFADDEGYVERKPRQLKMKIFPADDVLIEDSLNALVRSGMLHEMVSDQGPLLWVANWSKHQKINRPNRTRFTGISRVNGSHSVSAHRGNSESHLPEKDQGSGIRDQGTTPNGVVARKRATTKGTRIPDPFPVTDEMRDWARTNTPNVPQSEHDRFVDYWVAQPGQKGVKTDWVAVWRNWMRRAQDGSGGTGGVGGRGPAPRPTRGEENLAYLQRVMNEETRLEIAQ